MNSNGHHPTPGFPSDPPIANLGEAAYARAALLAADEATFRRLDLQSTEGAGSTFTLVLPLAAR